MTEETNKIKLLPDEVTQKDELGGHELIANVIYDTIHEEKIGKSIALIGGWGTGKSSIVEMVKAKLDNICHVFIFNAWEHEGDPLKRTFLESLIEFGSEKKLLTDKEKWEKEKNRLAKRIEEVESTNYTRINKLGYLLLFSTLLVPIGAVLLSKWPALIPCWHVFGVICILTPVITSAIIFIYSRFEKDKQKRDKILSVLIDKSEKTTNTTTYKTADPTSIEFQNVFISIFKEIHTNSNKEFLIVIDNLDRIQSGESLKIWATMKTFFEIDFRKKGEWTNKIWLLVPFDLEGVKHFWANGAKLAESFIDKTFQIKFNVPPLVLTNWEEYFKDKMKIAFQKFLNDTEIHNVFRIYRLACAHDKPPTPRAIKLFINNLIVYYRTWGKNIDLRIQVLYVILRNQIWNDEKVIIENLLDSENKFLKDIHLRVEMFPSDFKEYLAALYFNVDKDTAIQLLLGPKLEKALTNVDEKVLEDLNQFKWVVNVAEEIIESNFKIWASENPNLVAKVCLALAKLNIRDCINLDNCWTYLRKSLENIEKWNSVEDNSIEGITELFNKYKQEKSVYEALIDTLNKSNTLYEKGSDSKYTSKEVTEIKGELSKLAQLLNLIISNGFEEVIKQKFKIKTLPITYCTIIYCLVQIQDYDKVLKFFIPDIDHKKIINELVGILGRGQFNDTNWVTVINALIILELEWNFKAFADAIGMRLKDTLDLKPAETVNLVKIILDINQYENKRIS
ncbi:MAG: KAP family NTPase [Chlorobi bacterium]|nr:KAP family NTPase [Chlorobiota bacterium]MCI0715708.1 KAP family NTPase [Chlorobiota bacterium]